jgi:hypothetical protein
MRKYVAHAMAIAAFAGALSFSGATIAAESLIKPVDPGLKPAVEENCHDKKSYGGFSFKSFSGGEGRKSGRRGRDN